MSLMWHIGIYQSPPSARDVTLLPPGTFWLLDDSLYNGYRDGVEVECLEEILRGIQISV